MQQFNDDDILNIAPADEVEAWLDGTTGLDRMSKFLSSAIQSAAHSEMEPELCLDRHKCRQFITPRIAVVTSYDVNKVGICTTNTSFSKGDRVPLAGGELVWLWRDGEWEPDIDGRLTEFVKAFLVGMIQVIQSAVVRHRLICKQAEDRAELAKRQARETALLKLTEQANKWETEKEGEEDPS